MSIEQRGMASGIHCSIGTVSTATPLARAITKTGVKFLLIRAIRV